MKVAESLGLPIAMCIASFLCLTVVLTRDHSAVSLYERNGTDYRAWLRSAWPLAADHDLRVEGFLWYIVCSVFFSFTLVGVKDLSVKPHLGRFTLPTHFVGLSFFSVFCRFVAASLCEMLAIGLLTAWLRDSATYFTLASLSFFLLVIALSVGAFIPWRVRLATHHYIFTASPAILNCTCALVAALLFRKVIV